MRQRQPSDRAAMARALMQQGASTAPVQHWLQGLARATQGIVGGYMSGEEEREGKARDEEMLARMIGDRDQTRQAETAQLAQAGVPGFQMPMPQPVPGEAQQVPIAPAGGGDVVMPANMPTPPPQPPTQPVDARMISALMSMGAAGNQTAAGAAPAFAFQYQDQMARERDARQEAMERQRLAVSSRETFGQPVAVAGADGAPTLVQIGNLGTVRPLQGGFQPPPETPKPPTPTEAERLALAAGLQPGTPEFQQAIRAILESKARGPTTTINMPQGQAMGAIPPGQMVIEDPTAPGGFRMIAIAGGPADRALAKEGGAEGAKREGAIRTSNIVLEDIDRITKLMDTSLLPTVGMGAGLAGRLRNTGASDINLLLEGIKANIGFKQLNDMRAESPTGGALGQVTERELAFLQAVQGSLDQAQSPPQFRRTLARLRDAFAEVVHGPQWRSVVGGGGETTPTAGPAGVATPPAQGGDRPPLSSFGR